MAYLDDSIRSTSELSPTFKLFLHTLSSYADTEGKCWPSQRTLAQAMSMSVPTVQRCLKEAVELKLLEVRRRWRKSNVYRLLCLKESQNSTMTSRNDAREQPPDLKKNVEGKRLEKFVSPKEIQILLGDLEEIVGPETSQRNRGWFLRIIRVCGWDWLQEAISWLRCRILEGEMVENPVRSPSALLCWRLRTQGAVI